MLRVIAQSGMSTAEDVAESLQLNPTVIESGIRFALFRGWIEETGGYYQITWRWFRTINRVLSRQNLLAR
jgi:DNA-binding IclR family transcriptional regulator